MFRVNVTMNRNLRSFPSSILASISTQSNAISETQIARIFQRTHHHNSCCGSRRVELSFPKFRKINLRQYSSNGGLPSHQRVTLPALSPTMEMGTIISWEKKEGDKLNEGDLLAEIETDKATMGFETPDEGYLAKILVAAGSKDIPLGQLLCIIVENESDIAAFKDFVDSGESTAPSSPPPPPQAPTTTAPPQAPTIPAPPPAQPTIQQIPASPPSGRIFASPLAKRLASEKGISLMNVQGSGPLGRIRAQDLDSAKVSDMKIPVAALSPPVSAAPPVETATFFDIPVTALKQEAARQTLLSKQSIPHYYLTVDIEMDKLLSLKDELNTVSLKEEGPELSTTDFLIKATALACQKIPEANSSWQQTFIRQYKSVDINVVMSSGSNESVTPLIQSVDKKGLVSISSELNNLSAKILDGSLQTQQPQLGTFTFSSLGMYGVKNVINIITPPQSCCLGVGAVQERLIPDESEIGYRSANVMSVTLSCDHRVIDGAVGAKWLQHFKKFLEKPHTMLL